MDKLHEIYNRIKETRQQARELRKLYKDELSTHQEYGKIVEELDALKIKKKQIETQVKENNFNNFKKLDAFKMHVKTDMEMLSDLAINQLMAGQTVEILDENNGRYEPIFTVKFKKA